MGALIHMTKPSLKIVSPTTVKRKVAEVRTREYLTEREVEQLIKGCNGNRRPHRDATMILLAFRHGLRASELCDLQWTQVDFDHASLAVTRAKNGTPATHPLTGRELRALRRLHREAEGKSPFLFVSERGSPMTVSNFQKLINRATEATGLEIKAHPHMLRHACGGHDMQILSGHISPETAYVVEDYPYGLRLRCRIRYWLEHTPKRGFRFWSQTTNPKRGNIWNKPKASTYC